MSYRLVATFGWVSLQYRYSFPFFGWFSSSLAKGHPQHTFVDRHGWTRFMRCAQLRDLILDAYRFFARKRNSTGSSSSSSS